MDFIDLGYPGLFVVCFLSATILPMASEAFVLAMLYVGFDPWWTLFLATTGNSLGSITNYLLGMLGDPKWLSRLGVTYEKVMRLEHRIRKNGYWLALLSWVPFIGDPLMVALGFFRVPWVSVTLLIFVSKFLRYLVLCLLWLI